jgi:excisionase family DNA binding protein
LCHVSWLFFLDGATCKFLDASKWLSAFLESYRPPLDGERYLTDGEVSELLRVSRRTLQEYRNNRVLPFILLGGKVLYPETGLRGVLEANYRKPLE